MKTCEQSRGFRWARIVPAAFAVLLCVTVESSYGTSITLSGGVCGGTVGEPDYQGGAPVTLSATCSNVSQPFGTDSTAVQAEASLTTMRLFLDYSADIGNVATTNGPGTSVSVIMEDHFVVTGGTGSGLLEMSWNVEATLAAEGAFASGLSLSTEGGQVVIGNWSVCGGQADNIFGPCVPTSDGAVSTTVTLSVPFEFGAETSVIWYFAAGVGTTATSGPITSHGTVDAFNTAQLQPLVVLDGTGSRVASASVLSESGFAYEVASAPASVPEPASAALLGLGLFGLAWVRGRKRA